MNRSLILEGWREEISHCGALIYHGRVVSTKQPAQFRAIFRRRSVQGDEKLESNTGRGGTSEHGIMS